MAEAEAAFRSLVRCSVHDDPQAAFCANTAARGLGLTLAWAGSADAGEVIRRHGHEGVESQWAMAMALHEMSYGSAPLAYRHLDRATIAASDGPDDEYWMVHLAALGLAVASGQWGAASAASDRMVDALERSGSHPRHPHLVRIGRSTKWERLSAARPNVGDHPENAANWIRILANLYQVRQVTQVRQVYQVRQVNQVRQVRRVNHLRGGL